MALIGKNISHSKSKDVYENLLKRNIDYTLLDYPSEVNIPPLKDLLKEFPRISVTAPYKSYIFKRIDHFEKNSLGLSAVNAIKMDGIKIVGTNTDLLAFDKLFQGFGNFNNERVIILGNGNMANMISKYFKSINVVYSIFSRKNHKLDQFNSLYSNEKLIINTCSREYFFNHDIADNALFWDMNYAQDKQKDYFFEKKSKYLDGYSLLLEQARFALSFWN